MLGATIIVVKSIVRFIVFLFVPIVGVPVKVAVLSLLVLDLVMMLIAMLAVGQLLIFPVLHVLFVREIVLMGVVQIHVKELVTLLKDHMLVGELV